MTRAVRCAGCALVLAAVALAGCGRKTEAAGTSDLGGVKMDTANNTPMDGVSDQQLRAQAQALTPEQAAAQGMVDTTIHVENLGESDSDNVRVAVTPADTVAATDSGTAATAAPRQ